MENSVGIVGSIAKLGKNRSNAVGLENSVGIVGSTTKLGKNRSNVVGLENSVGIVGSIGKLGKNRGNAVGLENSVGIVGWIAKLGKNRGNVVGLQSTIKTSVLNEILTELQGAVLMFFNKNVSCKSIRLVYKLHCCQHGTHVNAAAFYGVYLDLLVSGGTACVRNVARYKCYLYLIISDL